MLIFWTLCCPFVCWSFFKRYQPHSLKVSWFTSSFCVFFLFLFFVAILKHLLSNLLCQFVHSIFGFSLHVDVVILILISMYVYFYPWDNSKHNYENVISKTLSKIWTFIIYYLLLKISPDAYTATTLQNNYTLHQQPRFTKEFYTAILSCRTATL